MGEDYIVVYHLWDTYGWTSNWRYDAGSEKNNIELLYRWHKLPQRIININDQSRTSYKQPLKFSIRIWLVVFLPVKNNPKTLNILGHDPEGFSD